MLPFCYLCISFNCSLCDHLKDRNVSIGLWLFHSREEICVIHRCSVDSWVIRVFHVSWRMITRLTEEQVSTISKPVKHVLSQLLYFFIGKVHQKPVGENNIIAETYHRKNETIWKERLARQGRDDRNSENVKLNLDSAANHELVTVIREREESVFFVL